MSLALSIFFFSADGNSDRHDKYELVFECARLADRYGFTAVWTPERHFTPFGGLYPNPAVLGAAIATQTKHIGIRAGSVVLPLHSVIRIVEEWSVVDNISGGRVALAIASGWHKPAFVLNPAAFADRRERLERDIAMIRRLWAGETVSFPGVDGEQVGVVAYPRPIQRKLDIWLTASSSDSWVRAGKLGANVLCLLGSSDAQLEKLVTSYRSARASFGHDPRGGEVTVMVHTYLHPDLAVAKCKVRVPLMNYLKEHMTQKFGSCGSELEHQMTSRQNELLEFGFEKRFQDSLIGPKEKCRSLLQKLSKAGATEVACLVDFGLSKTDVLAGVHLLAELLPTK